MPSRDDRRAMQKEKKEKTLKVEDSEGNLFEIRMSDISARDEFEYIQVTEGKVGGLCDIFLENKVTLTGIAGLIWAYRRKWEKKLNFGDVLKTINMSTIETLELDDGEDELPSDDPQRKLEEIASANPPNSDGESGTSSPVYAPSTD